MAETVVRCGKCGLMLDESPDTPPPERRGCPRCGLTARAFEVNLGVAVRLVARAVGQPSLADAEDPFGAFAEWVRRLSPEARSQLAVIVGSLAISLLAFANRFLKAREAGAAAAVLAVALALFQLLDFIRRNR